MPVSAGRASEPPIVKSSDFRGECLNSTGCALVGQDLSPYCVEARCQEAGQGPGGCRREEQQRDVEKAEIGLDEVIFVLVNLWRRFAG